MSNATTVEQLARHVLPGDVMSLFGFDGTVQGIQHRPDDHVAIHVGGGWLIAGADDTVTVVDHDRSRPPLDYPLPGDVVDRRFIRVQAVEVTAGDVAQFDGHAVLVGAVDHSEDGTVVITADGARQVHRLHPFFPVGVSPV